MAPDPIASAAVGGMFARGRAPGSATAGGAACPSSRHRARHTSTRFARITSAPMATPRARTPAIDSVARDGVRFDRAYATAPITLTSHASLMTGRYPPGHGARHNGMRLDLKTPTLAEAFSRGGLQDGRLRRGVPARSPLRPDQGIPGPTATQMPRDADGHLANERPGRLVVDEALAWLDRASRGRALPLGAPLRAARAVRRSRRPGTVRASGDRAL